MYEKAAKSECGKRKLMFFERREIQVVDFDTLYKVQQYEGVTQF